MGKLPYDAGGGNPAPNRGSSTCWFDMFAHACGSMSMVGGRFVGVPCAVAGVFVGRRVPA